LPSLWRPDFVVDRWRSQSCHNNWPMAEFLVKIRTQLNRSEARSGGRLRQSCADGPVIRKATFGCGRAAA
jgi:hypothetical protein